MIRLVCLYGVGDAYLACSLASAFERRHGLDVEVTVKQQQSVIPEMFGLRYAADDALVARGEGDRELWRLHENEIADGATFFAHPHFVRTAARLDQLTVKPRVSQADMYRALLGLSPWTQMDEPRMEGEEVADVVLLTRSNSWPELPAAFWVALAETLGASATVLVNDPSIPLGDLLRFCAGAARVVGPQCGTMAAVCEMGLSARKTIAVRELGPDCPYLFGLTESMPYGHCSTFAGNDHPDVGHVVVPASGWESSIEEIVGDHGGGA